MIGEKSIEGFRKRLDDNPDIYNQQLIQNIFISYFRYEQIYKATNGPMSKSAKSSGSVGGKW